MTDAPDDINNRAVQIQFPEKFDYAVSYEEREIRIEDDACALKLTDRLLVYALKQQGKHGPNTNPAPSWWNARDYAMWSAWSELKDRSAMEAMVFFVQRLDQLEPEWLLHEIRHRDSLEAKSAPPPPAAEPSEPQPSPPPEAAESTTPHLPAAPAAAEPAATPQLPRGGSPHPRTPEIGRAHPQPPGVSASEEADNGQPRVTVHDMNSRGSVDFDLLSSEGYDPADRGIHSPQRGEARPVLAGGVAGAVGAGGVAYRHAGVSGGVVEAESPGLNGSSREELYEQIQVLRYRLNTALRDVQERDERIVVLASENQRLQTLLLQGGGCGVLNPTPPPTVHGHGLGVLPGGVSYGSVDDLCSGAAGRPAGGGVAGDSVMEGISSRTATPLPVPNQAYVCHPPRKQQSWMGWLTGDKDSGKLPTQI